MKSISYKPSITRGSIDLHTLKEIKTYNDHTVHIWIVKDSNLNGGIFLVIWTTNILNTHLYKLHVKTVTLHIVSFLHVSCIIFSIAISDKG